VKINSKTIDSAAVGFPPDNFTGLKPRIWQGIPGIEKTAKGRLFVTWFSGGAKEPEPENTIYLCTSDDGGKTFTEPAAFVLPTSQARAFDDGTWRAVTPRTAPGHLEFDLDLPPLRGRFLIGGAEGMPLPTFN
jgi:hypothetical protein